MQNEPSSWLEILMVAVGALVLLDQGFNYTRQEKVLDVGPIHATLRDTSFDSTDTRRTRRGRRRCPVSCGR
jgi:hypothetical protein